MYVEFRYSDTDFCAYLMALGYEDVKIEVTRDKFNKLKAYVYFGGEKDELISLHKKYKNKQAFCNVLEFSINRRKITKLIKAEILNYQANNL